MPCWKIATYNVNSIRSRMSIVMPWIRENRPDILCLQETKVANPKFPQKEFEDEGYHVDFYGEKQYNGVATISLHKPESVSFGFPEQEPTDRDRIIISKFQGVTVINTYVPQGRERETAYFTYKLDWFRRLRALLETSFRAEDPVIWCGDLNVAPESIDVHDPKRLLGHVDFSPEVWVAFEHVKSWGFIDLFRKAHPGEPDQYTFYDYRVIEAVEKKRGWRVDHILATAPLAERLKTCRIDIRPRLADKPSDHTILLAEIHEEKS